ncbi:MAG: hypothetical protein HY777_02525 [Betaproteobacteria bacterium]|nr:hypothetical protein [Betaproteobacteria bacterium]
MPYYVYRVRPFAQLDKQGEFDTYKTASALAKALRAEAGAGSGGPGGVKLIFADDELHAEDLLCQVREPVPEGDG